MRQALAFDKQVARMSKSFTNYLIIGNGRMATHLCHYFRLLDIPHQHWHRQLPDAELTESLSLATHCIVAIKDTAISQFVENHYDNTKTYIHCSGAIIAENAFTAHPLQTFSTTLYSLEDYRRIPFIIEAEGPDFTELLPNLPNPHYRITREQKPFYHALCVMANNFTTLLWQKVFREFEATLQIEPQALVPLLEQTLHNIKHQPASALTGPLARGDTATLNRNLEALRGDNYRDIYQAFINSTKTHEYS